MVHYNETNLPWAIQPSNIIFQKFNMSGIVFIHYGCQESEVYTFLLI